MMAYLARKAWILVVAACLAASDMAAGQLPDADTHQIKVLNDFEQDTQLKVWGFRTQDYSLSDQHATLGSKTLKIPSGQQIKWQGPQDWSGYDAIELDAFVEGDAPVKVSIIIRDKTGDGYWDWHNNWAWLQAGANTLSLPVEGMFRGEPSARKGDIHTPIDPKEIVWLVLGFDSKGKIDGIYLDNLRLVKESRPKDVVALDFGPESQALWPGFSPITWNTVHGKDGAKAGFKQPISSAKRAADDTFPTRLYQDFVPIEPGNELILDMPNGFCQVWLVFNDCGYWDGQQARHRRRTIRANGKDVWSEDRGAEGITDYLFRFESVEPRPGDSMWDLYMAGLFRPARFEAEVTDGKLRIDVVSDGWLSTKVAALIAYPNSAKEAGDKWVTQVEANNRKEFEKRAVYLGPNPVALDTPADAKAKGYWLGFPRLDDDLSLLDAPGNAQGQTRRAGIRGQRQHFTFALRPLKDFSGDVKLTCTDLTGSAGAIPAAAVDLRYVHHALTRGNMEIAYQIVPHTLRHVNANLKLSKDLTRQFVAIVTVPAETKAGVYSGEVSLTAGDLKVSVPLSIDVADVALDEPDFIFGFFASGGAPPTMANPRQSAKDLAKLLRDNGMNTLCGGPTIAFRGLDDAGKPILDFGKCDEFFRDMKEVGFTKAMYSVGGPGGLVGLHDAYVIGNTGQAWEKKTGKSFNELLKITWTAIREHAEREGWPELYHYYIEEPASPNHAKGTLELAKAYAEAAPWVKFGGYYSVHWERKDDVALMLQELFKVASWNSMNLHTQTDFDKAREFGREIHIYNQALSRFSFGAYQWAEMHKGAKGRAQWNTLALYGYQFFDLDGREPDAGVINFGRNEIYPSLRLARSCEGALDFRLAVTLWNTAQKKKDSAASKAAIDFLEGVNKAIAAGQRKAPAGFMDDETFRNTCIGHLRNLLTARTQE